MLDDSSVAAFAQLGANFFAAARERLAGPAETEVSEEAFRARHQRMVQNARWRRGARKIKEAIKQIKLNLMIIVIYC